MFVTGTGRLPDAAAIEAFDCRAASSFSRVDALNVGECKDFSNDDIALEEVNVQILQERRFSNFKIVACKVRATNLITHCGIFSHASAFDGGLGETEMLFSRDECLAIHRNGSFLFGQTLVTGIGINQTVTRSITAFGKLEASNCVGSAFAVDGITFTNAVMQSSLSIELRERWVTQILRDSSFKIGGVMCCVKEGTCHSASMGHIFWEEPVINGCSSEGQDILYEGPAIVANPSEEDRINAMVNVHSGETLLTLKLRSRKHICFQNAFETDHEGLSVIFEFKEGAGFFFKKSNASRELVTVDLPLYFNSKITYVATSLQKQLKEIYADTKLRDCLLNKRILEQKLAQVRAQEHSFFHPINASRGYKTILSGQVLYIFKCELVKVKARRTSKCYKQLPVIYKDQEVFVEPNSMSIMTAGTEIECSPLTPPMYKLKNTWFNFNANPTYPTAGVEPTRLNPNLVESTKDIVFEDYSNLVSSGLYPANTMVEYAKFLNSPQEAQAAMEFVIHSVRNFKDENSGSFGFPSISGKEELKKLSSQIFSHMTSLYHEAGTLGGIVFLCTLIWSLLKLAMAFSLNYRILQTNFGNGSHLFAAFFNSLTSYLVNKAPRAEKPEEQGQVAV